jgi:hypothetical protein
VKLYKSIAHGLIWPADGNQKAKIFDFLEPKLVYRYLKPDCWMDFSVIILCTNLDVGSESDAFQQNFPYLHILFTPCVLHVLPISTLMIKSP